MYSPGGREVGPVNCGGKGGAKVRGVIGARSPG